MTEEELKETKIYKTAEKVMGKQNLREFLKRGDQELKDLIALNSVHIQEATAQTKSNDAYRSACNVKKDFEAGLRETIKPHKVANDLASTLLSMRKALR